MSEDWDEFNSKTLKIVMCQEAGEWAVVAMACMVCADDKIEESEIEKAKELVAKTSIITNSIGREFGEQLFLDTVERIRTSPETEIGYLKSELQELATKIEMQDHRDHAFQTLLAIATADHEIAVSEYKLMKELKESIGSEVMVPLPHISV